MERRLVLVMCCKQKTAYEMRISDWSSDVCSSVLVDTDRLQARTQFEQRAQLVVKSGLDLAELDRIDPAVAERLADHAGPRAAGLDGEDEQVEQRGIAHRAPISERYRDVLAGRGQRLQAPVNSLRQHTLTSFGEVQACLGLRIDLVVICAACSHAYTGEPL